MSLEETIKSYKKVLDTCEDDEIKNSLKYNIDSMELELKISNNYDNIIDKVFTMFDNSILENKVSTSMAFVNFIKVLKELDNVEGKIFLDNIQTIFKEIPVEDSEEIMRHVYSKFFYNRIRSLI